MNAIFKTVYLIFRIFRMHIPNFMGGLAISNFHEYDNHIRQNMPLKSSNLRK